MKKTLIAVTFITIFLASLTSASLNSQIECQGANQIIEVNLFVEGENCQNSTQAQDSASILVNEAGLYNIKGIVERGNPDQCQTKEEFFIKIKEQEGSIAEDDDNACAISSRLDGLGEFRLESGEINVNMHTAAKCPPGRSSNSVNLTHLCLFLEGTATCSENSDCDDENPLTFDQCLNPGTNASECHNTEINCASDLDCGITGFVGDEFCTDNNLFKNFRTSTCNNAEQLNSFCTREVVPKLILECQDICDGNKCVETPLFLNIISPESKRYNLIEIPIQLESNGEIIEFTIDSNSTRIVYASRTKRIFAEGIHTLTAFATKNNNTISKSVTFIVDQDDARESDSDKRKEPFKEEEYFNGTGLALNTKPNFALVGNYINQPIPYEALQPISYETPELSETLEISEYAKPISSEYIKLKTTPKYEYSFPLLGNSLGISMSFFTTSLLLVFLLVILIVIPKR